MGIMSAQQEQHYRNAEEKLLCGCVLIPVVDLLPHIQVVVCAGVELKRDTTDVVKHEIGTEHVGDVGESPGCLLRDTGDDVE